MSDELNIDGIPDVSYPDWIYVKVAKCLEAESSRQYDCTVYQDIRHGDSVAVWDSGDVVTLFFDGLQAINLPPMLAHAVRYNGVTE